MDYVHRDVTYIMTVRMRDEQVLTLTGARQAGKTTLCEQELPGVTGFP